MSKIYLAVHPWTKDEIFESKSEALQAFSWLAKTDTQPVITEMEKTDYLLRNVPEEFKATLSYMAYERGHSAGQQEVELILEGLVSSLLPDIKRFEKRLIGS